MRTNSKRMIFGLQVLVLCLAVSGGCLAESCGGVSGEIVYDFETGDLQGWSVVEGGFGMVVCDRDTFHNGGAKYNKQGKYFVSTLETEQYSPSDGYTGVIGSPVMELDKGEITLKVGGGSSQQTKVALYVLNDDGSAEEVAAAHGNNIEKMETVRWDMPELVGKRVFVRVVDSHTGGWGHITLDDFQAHGKIVAGAGEPGRLEREAILSNPIVKKYPLIFVTRNQYRPDHHNTATFFPSYNNEYNDGRFQPGGALKKLDVASGKVSTLLEAKEGVIRDPEVYFDGSKIIFSMRRSLSDSYHIYEINADGTGLRQLTFAEKVDDIDPLYMPDDTIVFSSSREPKYCMCNRHIMCNLYKMGPDGENIHQIGKSTLFEGHSSLLPDGRIVYDRWEYVDRNFGDAQGLWTVNPDGTNHAVYWGNNTNSPGGVLDPRAVPGTQQIIATFSSCHDRPWGALALVDRRLGLDGKEPVVRTWPAGARELVGVGNYDTFKRVMPKYEDPYPLDDKYFLCSRTVKGEQMGIFLVDMNGKEFELYFEEPGCFDPMPLSPRSRPIMPVEMRSYASGKSEGEFYVTNVYEGTHMLGVKRGDVKWLRVVESPEKRTRTMTAWSGQGTEWPAMGWHDFNNKRILGTVPVEEDGSVYFEVPAEKFVYFQLLDENKQMVQSMRSGAIVQPGEVRGCVGCHESRVKAPPVAEYKTAKALKREPSRLEGWYGAARTFSYVREVQPVFDGKCIKCHDYGTPGGAKGGLILSGDKTNTFNTSYNELWRKNYTGAVGAGPAAIQQAYSWGSHKSKLVAALKKEMHKDVKLSDEDYERIVTWLDINAPYYSEYSSAYPGNLAGRSPLDNDQLGRLGALTGYNFSAYAGYDRNKGPLINYDRPELSGCLAKLSGEKYDEALVIILQGKRNLADRPRADMSGHVPCDDDKMRLAWYERRAEEERRNRDAIAAGEKVYDERVRREKGEGRRER